MPDQAEHADEPPELVRTRREPVKEEHRGCAAAPTRFAVGDGDASDRDHRVRQDGQARKHR